jgi:hypothetical protein
MEKSNYDHNDKKTRPSDRTAVSVAPSRSIQQTAAHSETKLNSGELLLPSGWSLLEYSYIARVAKCRESIVAN